MSVLEGIKATQTVGFVSKSAGLDLGLSLSSSSSLSLAEQAK